MDGPNASLYNKFELRRELILRRKALEDKSLLSRAICERAQTLVGGRVMVYASMGSEVDTRILTERLSLRSDVVLFAPYTVDGKIFPRRIERSAVPDKQGNLPEACYANALSSENSHIVLDYCITPLLGFNDRGYRIGYGKGCYDRFFAETPCKKIGLAFECQRQQFSPEPFDMPLDCCVTEKKVIYF